MRSPWQYKPAKVGATGYLRSFRAETLVESAFATQHHQLKPQNVGFRLHLYLFYGEAYTV